MSKTILKCIAFFIAVAAFCGNSQALNKNEESDVKNLYHFEHDSKWGFMDEKGNCVIVPIYDYAYSYSEPMIMGNRVKIGNNPEYIDRRYGYIDSSGNTILDCSYYGAFEFSEGLALVIEFTGPTEYQVIGAEFENWVYIDINGNRIIELNCYMANSFSEGLAAVMPRENSGWGYIDKTGKYVIEPTYGSADDFSEGLAHVSTNKAKGYNGYVDGYIDRTGKFVIEPQYDKAGTFSEGKARVMKDKKWGFIDKTGAEIIGLEYSNAKDFKENLAPVQRGEKWGYIDESGKTIIPFIFDEANSFSEGVAAVGVDKKYGFINSSGKFVVEPQFYDVRTCKNGLIAVYYKHKNREVSQFGYYIDKNGKFVGPKLSDENLVVDNRSKDGKSIDVRINVEKLDMTEQLDLTGSTYNVAAEKVKAKFNKSYNNVISVINMEHSGYYGITVRVAAKSPAKNADNLCFYSYDETTNKCKLIKNTNAEIDKNGYLHFDTNIGGNIIISEGSLKKK